MNKPADSDEQVALFRHLNVKSLIDMHALGLLTRMIVERPSRRFLEPGVVIRTNAQVIWADV